MNVLIFADVDYFKTLLSDVRLSILNKLLEHWDKLNFSNNINTKIYYHLVAQDASKLYYNQL